MMQRILLSAMAAAAIQAHAVEAIDDRGVAVSLDRPAERIVALAPHLADIAYAAGAGGKLVGTSSYSRHPAEAERLPVVASAGRIDLERVIALRPDLVLAWRSGNSPLQIGRLERLGMRVFVTEVRTLLDVPRIIREVGILSDSEAVAAARAQHFEREIGRLRERHAGARRVSVLVEIWHRPMLAVGGGHLIGDALDTCAARNVFAGARTLTPLVSRERVLGAEPEAIVTGGFGGGARSAWQGYEAVPAVRNRRIYAIDPDALYALGPYALEGVRALCARLDEARD